MSSAQPTSTEHPDTSSPRPTWRRWLFPALAVVATLAALLAFWAARGASRQSVSPAEAPPEDGPAFVGAVLQPPRPAPDLRLTDVSGGTFDLADARGKVTVLFFGFTSCPDVCPTTLTNLAYALQELGPRAADVAPVFVSVDPERDRPEIVSAFLGGYDDRVIGLVPDAGALRDVADRYGVVYEKEIPAGQPTDTPHYTMTHTASLFLIDPHGQLRVALVPPYTPADVAHDIGLLLDEAGGG